MQQFVKTGRIVKDLHALRVELDGRNGPGDLVIGATAVPELLSGWREMTIAEDYAEDLAELTAPPCPPDPPEPWDRE